MHVRGLRGELSVIPGTDDGIPWVTGQYRFFAAVTPGAGDLPSGSCDGLLLNHSAAAAVTVVGADDAAGTPVALTLTPGEIHPVGAIKVTAVAAGAVVACYHRKPGTF